MNRRRSPLLTLGVFRFSIFVPAIMSVGLAFWLASALRDLVRWRQAALIERQAIRAGRSAARLVHPDPGPPVPEHLGLRHRPAYLVAALALGTLGLYIFLGSLFNYLRADGYLENEAWVLSLATVVATGFGITAVAALVTWLRWPDLPRWVSEIHARTSLTRMPLDRCDETLEPAWGLSAAALLVPTVTVVWSFLVATDWRFVNWLDVQITELVESAGRLDFLEVFDPLGSPVVGVAVAAAVAIAALRCRPLAAAYPAAVVVGLVVVATTENLVPRDRPAAGPLAGMTDSFPSTHLAMATLLAGLLPLGVAALADSRRFVWPLRVLLGLGVLGSAVHRIDTAVYQPSDLVGGALIGLSLVVAVEWVIGHRGWHRACRGCVWAPEAHGPPLLGVVHLDDSAQKAVRLLAHLLAAASVVVLTVLTLRFGVPTDPGEGAVFGPHIQRPVQIGLALVASLGALISWKWDAVGAVILAFAGAGLAVFSAIEYPPFAAMLLALMFIVPAVLLWLSWQHRRTMAEIIGLATVTAVLLGATFLGVVAVHGFYFGPTHPDSEAAFVAADDVTWVWVGGVTADRAVVTAGLNDEETGARVALVVRATGVPEVRVSPANASTEPAVRFEIDGLEPDTEYTFDVEVDGELDGARGEGRFRTAPDGAASFRFAVGACVRTDSNGAVFDAIAADDPLFFLNIGDIHYGNIESADPADYRTAYERMLAKPGQAAFYRSVPLAHTWDDHDFGPNDSDSTHRGRDAARLAYRQMVPHHPLVHADEGPINHAFTVGRVRFVLADLRSEKTDATMLGADQEQWLVDELTEASRTHGLVVWVSSVPWIADARAGADHWGGYPEERRRIADALADAGVDNLMMLAGDAHMVALDDGTNSDYSADRVGGFPVVHSAALDRPGGTKGGPYSHGTYPGGGRYVVFDVADDGSGIEMTVRGLTYDGEELLAETFTFGA